MTLIKQSGVNKLDGRRVLPPGELRCICAVVEWYRRRQTTGDDDRRRQTPDSITSSALLYYV